MKSGYKIYWTDNAISELQNTIKFLQENWTEIELKKLVDDIEKIIELISNNPKLFPLSNKKNIRRVIIRKLNTLYYRELNGTSIEILSFFSNRQNPDKRKI